MIRTLIADDHVMVLRGLRQIVEAEYDISVVGEARNGDEVLQLVRDQPADVVVLDITMPGRNGLETLKELRRSHPKIGVIILSMHPKDQYAVRVLRAGASAYITKESAPEELVLAIRKAYRGEKYISPDVAELLADFVEKGPPDEPHKILSDREFEVLRLIASGKGISQIAELLQLSVKTVSTYRTRIIEKTGLRSNSDFTRYAIEHKLVS
jgi:two-component system invasion response regulator UvrY